MNFRQITDRILMVRPACFGFNQETAASNSFQHNDMCFSPSEVANQAIVEFDGVVDTLLACNIDVTVVQDTETPVKTDAVFPNNWISFHETGTIITYPMMSPNRRQEIRDDIIEDLKIRFAVNDVWRWDKEVNGDIFLEGTGSLVLDRENRIAYACHSPRTDKSLLQTFCRRMNYRPVIFDAVFSDELPFYHTNVVMAVTRKHVVICLESMRDVDQRKHVELAIERSGKTIVDINLEQVGQFAGNMLQVGKQGERPLLIMSKTSRGSLKDDQVAVLENESDLLALSIPIIEKYSGGSIRCMLAEIFVEPR